jgi:hypothetical protein
MFRISFKLTIINLKMNIWYPVRIKKDLPKLEKLRNAVNLYVKVTHDENEFYFTIWNGFSDGENDFEQLTVEEAMDHLESIRGQDGKPTKVESKELDLEWFKCIHPEWKYRKR